MKKILILAGLVACVASQNALARTYYLVNSTPFEVEFNVHYATVFCKADRGIKVAAFDKYAINAGGCLITSVDAQVFQKMTGGQQVEGVSTEEAVPVIDKFEGSSNSATWVVYGLRGDDRKLVYRLTNQGLPKTAICQ